MMFSDQEKISELTREVAMRRTVYPGQVAQGKLTPHAAQRRIEILQEIIAEYRARVQLELDLGRTS